MYRGQELKIFDLSGGQASNRAVTDLEINQAIELYNIHSLPGGGIETRNPDSEHNTTAMNSGVAITGLHYYRQADGDKFFVATAGNKAFADANLTGTFTDITGAFSLPTGQNNLWTTFTAGDAAIFVGGNFNNPFKYTGTGNISAFGSPTIAARFGFFHNNRVFLGPTTANRSRLHWSTLLSTEDFSGTGSGTMDIDANDGDELMAAAPLNTDVVLLFKRNSIHQILTQASPFPRFPLFKNTGAVGPQAVVVHNGIAYYVDINRRMKATDGSKPVDFPSDMDDVWDSISSTRLEFTIGFHYKADNYEFIGWLVSTGSNTSHNLCILWDLNKKSWWRYPTGYKANAVTQTDDRMLYMGHYDGKVYLKDDALRDTDASEGDDNVVGLWRSGWNINDSLHNSIHPYRINLSIRGEDAGQLQVAYGFDFAADQSINYISIQGQGMVWDEDLWDIENWAGASDLIRHVFVFGRGSAFQVMFTNQVGTDFMFWDQDNWDEDEWGVDVTATRFRINGFTVSGKPSSQKIFQAA